MLPFHAVMATQRVSQQHVFDLSDMLNPESERLAFASPYANLSGLNGSKQAADPIFNLIPSDISESIFDAEGGASMPHLGIPANSDRIQDRPGPNTPRSPPMLLDIPSSEIGEPQLASTREMDIAIPTMETMDFDPEPVSESLPDFPDFPLVPDVPELTRLDAGPDDAVREPVTAMDGDRDRWFDAEPLSESGRVAFPIPRIELPDLEIDRWHRLWERESAKVGQAVSRSVASLTDLPARIWEYPLQGLLGTMATHWAGAAPSRNKPLVESDLSESAEVIATDLPDTRLAADSMHSKEHRPVSNPMPVEQLENAAPDPPNQPSFPATSEAGSQRVPLDNLRDRLAMRRSRRRLPVHESGEPQVHPPHAIPRLSGPVFPLPNALIEDLESLATDPRYASWARATIERIEHCANGSVEDPAWIGSVQAAVKSATTIRRLATEQIEPQLQARLLCVHHALLRRIAMYQAVYELAQQAGTEPPEAAVRRHLAARIAGMESVLRKSPNGSGWRTYFELDVLNQVVQGHRVLDDAERLELARKIADRMAGDELTQKQRAFVRSRPVDQLREALQHWVMGPVDIPRLLKRIEHYETTGIPALGHAVATDIDRLCWSSDTGSRRLVAAIRQHYCNANLRLAVSDDFLNRMVPQPNQVLEPVRDQVAGAAVAGRSHTATAIAIKYVPDPQKLRVALVARGIVHSATASASGPAVFHSTGHTHYLARKLFVLSQEGMTAQPATADAVAENRLRAMDTRFDGIPIINLFARSMVLKEHDRSHDQAISEIETKVANKARHQLDIQTAERLARLEQRLRDKVLAPIESLALDAEAVHMQTTEDRAILRMRFAGQTQIAAHTPRPAAPADSDLSLQVHESTLNNALMQFDLEGREFLLPDLYHEIGRKLGMTQVQLPEDLPMKARITFARHDAVRIHCEEGRVHLILAIAKIKYRRTAFYDFKVHAYYRPQLDGLALRFVRDGVLDIEGAHLRPGDHIALQGIFVKVLTENRPYILIPPERNADPRLAGLMITQMVVKKGWFGFAIGPQQSDRIAWRHH